MKKLQPRWIKAAIHFIVHNERSFPESLRALGYAEKYITVYWKRILNDERVVKVIKEEHERIAEQKRYSPEKATVLLKALLEECKTNKDRTNRIAVIKELNKLHNFYKDEDGSALNIEQHEVTLEERKKSLLAELKLIDNLEVAPYCIAENG